MAKPQFDLGPARAVRICFWFDCKNNITTGPRTRTDSEGPVLQSNMCEGPDQTVISVGILCNSL